MLTRDGVKMVLVIGRDLLSSYSVHSVVDLLVKFALKLGHLMMKSTYLLIILEDVFDPAGPGLCVKLSIGVSSLKLLGTILTLMSALKLSCLLQRSSLSVGPM
jgi:hypothetical protein